MDVFSCWIGEQEKEIRNVKKTTTVKGLILKICERLEHGTSNRLLDGLEMLITNNERNGQT